MHKRWRGDRVCAHCFQLEPRHVDRRESGQSRGDQHGHHDKPAEPAADSVGIDTARDISPTLRDIGFEMRDARDGAQRSQSAVRRRRCAWNAARQQAPAMPRGFSAITGVPSNPAIGSVISLNGNASSSCGSRQPHGATIVAVSQHAIVAVDTLAPPNGFTNADLQSFAATFDTLIYPLDTLNFGVQGGHRRQRSRAALLFSARQPAVIAREQFVRRRILLLARSVPADVHVHASGVRGEQCRRNVLPPRRRRRAALQRLLQGQAGGHQPVADDDRARVSAPDQCGAPSLRQHELGPPRGVVARRIAEHARAGTPVLPALRLRAPARSSTTPRLRRGRRRTGRSSTS